MTDDLDTKNGKPFESACENWNDLWREPLDLEPIKKLKEI